MGPKLLLLFIVGDILGTGVYALTGEVAGVVGGASGRRSWSPSRRDRSPRCSYLELVTKYPQAAGAALYTHKAFGIHFVTFLVAFTVICSGITCASTSSTFARPAERRAHGIDSHGGRRRVTASRSAS